MDAKKLLINFTVFMIFILSSGIVFGWVNPAPYFCESQGYGLTTSFIVEYADKDVQFTSLDSKDQLDMIKYKKNMSDRIILYLTFRWPLSKHPDLYNSHPHIPITNILGLDEQEKLKLIRLIKNESRFGNSNVSKSTSFENEYVITGPIERLSYCNFPNGNDCSWIDFKDKKCGTEYRKELDCIKESESINIAYQVCCEGLEAYNPNPNRDGGALPICRIRPTNLFIIVWEWMKNIF